MRQLTDLEIKKIKLLTEKSVEFTLIEPTENGLQKSIMDATGLVRTYLKANYIHDYEFQKQGQDNKVQVNSFLISSEKLISSVASLYRPNTKKGDPRIWFKGLGAYSNANDILGIIAFESKLYILNVTQLDLNYLIENKISNPLQDLVNEINQISNEIANELLLKLRAIAAKGFVPALLQADTAIGRTLEYLLDIPMNSSKTPDYKGIELKSFRDKRANRKNLFAEVANWQMSKFKSSSEILENFGYTRNGVFRLYCTVSAIVRNSQGLMLKVDSKENLLFENSDKESIKDFVVWQLDSLRNSLAKKHKETFWIAADTKTEDGKEYFHFKKAEHTKKPIITQLDILLHQGIITLDHLIKKLPSGGVKEKGPIFKLKPNALNLLFPPSQSYSFL